MRDVHTLRMLAVFFSVTLYQSPFLYSANASCNLEDLVKGSAGLLLPISENNQLYMDLNIFC